MGAPESTSCWLILWQNLLLANTGKTSTCFKDRRKTKRVWAITVMLASSGRGGGMPFPTTTRAWSLCRGSCFFGYTAENSHHLKARIISYYGAAWLSMVRRGSVHGAAWLSMVRRGSVWCGVAQNGAAWLFMVRRGSVGSASACWKAGPSSILASAPQGGVVPLSRQTMRKWREASATGDG